MATPRGAEHRDLEQRLRKIERLLQGAVGAALRRKQLKVTEGDFSVSGGGSVVVQDGGAVRVAYPTGEDGITTGSIGSGEGVNITMTAPDGSGRSFGVDHVIFPAFGTDLFQLVFHGDRVQLSGAGSAQISMLSGGVDLEGEVTCYDGLTVNNTLDYLGAPTTGLAANLNYDFGNGRIRVVTSSERYKQDIEDAPDRADNLLAVRGRTWRDRNDVAENPETAHRNVGYIAEELADAGLCEYVVYDDQGRPDAIQYDRLTVPLLQLAQRQQSQIDELTRRLEALEGA